MTKPIRHLLLSALALPLIAGTALAQQPPVPPAQPPAAQAPAAPQPDARRPTPPQMTPLDRAAMLDARIAAVKAGLRLSPEQDALWGPLESAVREGMTKLADLRERLRTADRPADAIERMSRQAEASLIRGEALKRIADTARPLYASLSEEQRRRLPMLMNGPRNDRFDGRRMGRGDDRDGPRGRFGSREDDRRGPGSGMMDRRWHDEMMRQGERGGERDGMRRGERGDERDGMRRRGERDWGERGWDERSRRDRYWDEREDGSRRRWSDRDGYGRWN